MPCEVDASSSLSMPLSSMLAGATQPDAATQAPAAELSAREATSKKNAPGEVGRQATQPKTAPARNASGAKTALKQVWHFDPAYRCSGCLLQSLSTCPAQMLYFSECKGSVNTMSNSCLDLAWIWWVHQGAGWVSAQTCSCPHVCFLPQAACDICIT